MAAIFGTLPPCRAVTADAAEKSPLEVIRVQRPHWRLCIYWERTKSPVRNADFADEWIGFGAARPFNEYLAGLAQSLDMAAETNQNCCCDAPQTLLCAGHGRGDHWRTPNLLHVACTGDAGPGCQVGLAVPWPPVSDVAESLPTQLCYPSSGLDLPV
jgi:hypothetical protein